MKKVFFLLFIIAFFTQVFALDYDPVANPDALVLSGNARFTVLTSGLIRMEWADNTVFEDRASLAFVNRHLPVPKYKKSVKDGWLQIKTGKFTLRYKENSGNFNNENLQIEFEMAGLLKKWVPGLENKNNLMGTLRTLDGFDGEIMNWSTKKPIALEPGILSRDGWMLIDDTEKPLFDNSDWPWVTSRLEAKHQDLYFFCYGSDYKGAMKDFISVAGKISLPPKFVFGTWWSRYWEYTDWEYRELVEEFEIHDVPLDVLVVDMDWHITTKPEWYVDGKKIKDQAGEGIGWTGLTWNNNYFPDPKNFLKWTEEKDLKVCMNLHPASGIQPHEEQYPEMAKAMGIDPKTEKYVPFDIVNKIFAKNYMDIILHPMENDGVDFWWLDWQQWSTTKIPSVNPTFYLNYVFYSDMQRQNGKRPLIFHRYGGLGNHRYQIGFSGDTFINWKSLAYQPYFTSTAANVGFGFWSHDIGGHMYGDSTPELYTRWVQFGAFSPILRTHCTKSTYTKGIERRIWAYPLENFYAMRDAFHLRKALLPYIYTAAREAYDTGISLCRPMYYDNPHADEAYEFKGQYMFGNDMILSPVTEKTEDGKLIVQKDIWLPEGEWIEYYSGAILEGNQVLKRSFTIDEIPIYVRSGAIIPMYPKVEWDEKSSEDHMILTVYPGKSGKTRIYNDEGNSEQYKEDAFSFTEVSFTTNKGKLKLVIDPVEGSYPGMAENRSYEIRLALQFPAQNVKINGKAVSWEYDGEELCTHIYTNKLSVHSKVKIEVQLADYDIHLLSKKKGQFVRLIKFTKFLAKENWDKSKYSNDIVVHAAQTGHRITLNPDNINSEIKRFNENWDVVLEMINKVSESRSEFLPYLELLEATETK